MWLICQSLTKTYIKLHSFEHLAALKRNHLSTHKKKSNMIRALICQNWQVAQIKIGCLHFEMDQIMTKNKSFDVFEKPYLKPYKRTGKRT